jgi:hypothetical protein
MNNDVIGRVAFLGIFGGSGYYKACPKGQHRRRLLTISGFFQIGSLVDLW